MCTHAQQEDFMKELQLELSGCMSRAGQQREKGPAGLPSRSQMCSWGPVEEEQAPEVEWQNRKYGRRRTYSRGRSGLRWHQSPSPSHPSQHQSPSPSPPQSHPADEQLHCSLKILKLQPKSWESKSRTWWSDTSPQKEEKSREQVWFKVDEELGNEPDLPSDLTLFLAKGVTPKKRNASSLTAKLPTPPKAPSTAIPWQEEPSLKFWQQHPLINPTHGPRQERERLDPVRYPCPWIAEEMPHPTGRGRLRLVERST